jgi:hypothetical protein
LHPHENFLELSLSCFVCLAFFPVFPIHYMGRSFIVLFISLMIRIVVFANSCIKIGHFKVRNNTRGYQLVLDGCDGLQNVIGPDRLPSSLRLFSLDGYGPAAPRWTSTSELPLECSRPKCAPDTRSMESFKISKISLQGCIKLKNLFIRGLPNLEELDLSRTAIKKLDFETMAVNVPKLKRVFLLGCEHLRHIEEPDSNGSLRLDLICLDTRVGRASIFTRPPCLAHEDCLHLHAIFADARLASSLETLILNYYYHEGVHFSIQITSSTEYAGVVIEPDAVKEEMIETNTRRHHGCLANRYDGVLTKIGDALMLAFPEPPTQRLDCHIEFSDWSLSLDTESRMSSLSYILSYFVQSIHVHDAMMSGSMHVGGALKWYRVERCPNLDTIFGEVGSAKKTETIWVSNLLMARGICSKRFSVNNMDFGHLQHLHLAPAQGSSSCYWCLTTTHSPTWRRSTSSTAATSSGTSSC